MSVFTTVTHDQLAGWLKNYSIGTLSQLEGIASGIENTNYFVTTTHGRYVLTLFEKLQADELPFYLNLMAHLARHGIPCPQPIADLENNHLGQLNGKPASLVTCLPGKALGTVDARQCAIIGELLAQMHRAGESYKAEMTNPRGLAWSRQALPQIVPFLDAHAASLLENEVRFQSEQQLHAKLPRGVVHADLFRDNVLWNGAWVGGVIDFYFACTDFLLYDVAIAINDWTINDDAVLDAGCTRALLEAYHGVRPFTDAEREAWPAILRAAALRFWMSRLYDLHLPRAGELTHAKDPLRFQRIVEQHIARENELRKLFVL